MNVRFVCKSIHIARQYQSVLNNLYNTAQYSTMYPTQQHRLTGGGGALPLLTSRRVYIGRTAVC